MKKTIFYLSKWFVCEMLFPCSLIIFLILVTVFGQGEKHYYVIVFMMILISFLVAFIIVCIYYGRIVFYKERVFVPGLKEKTKLDAVFAIQYCINVKYEDIIGIRIVEGNIRNLINRKYNVVETAEIKYKKWSKRNIELLLKNRERKQILISGFSKKQQITIINELKARVSQYNDALKDIDAEKMVREFFGKK